MKRVIICIVSLLMLSLPLAAEVPHLINYQGILTDDTGTPLDGTYDLTFTIYGDSLTMTTLWTETHTGVAIDEGLFGLLLGSSNPLWKSLFVGTERWLGVTVEPDPELSPRMRMTSVPWAFRAAVADTAISVEWNMIASMPAGFADGVDDVGGAGDGHSLDAADGSPTDALYVDNDGNVGIGTTFPYVKLQVVGEIRFMGGDASTPDGHFKSSNGSASLAAYAFDSYNHTGMFFTGPGDYALCFTVVGTECLRIDNSGYVGIGTTNPARTLHVNDVMRLEPRSSAPSNPSEGDMYMDGTTHKLMVYDGITWQACF